MTITTVDGIAAGLLAGTRQLILLDRSSLAGITSGYLHSLWRTGSIPAQPAIPGAAAVLSNATTGAAPFVNPTGGAASYLAGGTLYTANAGAAVVLVDRLAHMGGLSGTVTTAQTANVDVSGSGDNLVARRGATDYSNVRWGLEIYTAIGATQTTATITYTNAAGTSGQTTTLLIGSTTAGQNAVGRLLEFVPPGGCRSVQSVTLTATTATAGSFGVTAWRTLGQAAPAIVGARDYDWATLSGKIEDSACLSLLTVSASSSSGIVRGLFNIIQG